jgi:protein SCO1/2
MRLLVAGPVRAPLWALLALAWGGCELRSSQTYQVTGQVRSVDRAAAQVVIAHDDIPGFMPPMTMSFDLASPALLDGVEPGARVRFALERSATLLRIVELQVTAPPEPGFQAVAAPPPPERAPDFELIDQEGSTFRLSGAQGRAVLLDFIFTRCPGPCPVLTAAHVRLQRRLPAELAARTHFVSVTLDPAYDTPERLREYAERRGADLRRWSFLTGDPAAVQQVLDAYHVGRVLTPDGEIDHLVVSVLVAPDGRIAHYYPGVQVDIEQIVADLQELLG